MGSAPVRQSWQTRVSSSAVRGAYQRSGAPGVRRIRQAASTSGAVAASGGGGGTGPFDWIEIVNGWVWDAGEYLGADFEDMIGYPTDVGGAYELRWIVLPPGSDSNVLVTNDPYSQEPNGTATVDNPGDPPNWFENPDPSTPDAGSHLWVWWYGPDFNPATDTPPAVAPATLVPAALAANGTA